MTINEYFGDWSKIVDLMEAERLMRQLITFKQPICPLPKDIFKAFTLCSLYDLKVVIIGQDPYPNIKDGLPIATGIAFGNHKGTLEENYSPSLRILMESVIDYTIPHGNIIFDPSLEKWEKQGMLMLNSALSCAINRPNSHTLMWRPFIKSFLINLSKHTTGIIYVLMGSTAQSFGSYINPKFNYIMKIEHPSWYARTHQRMPSELWKQISSILIDHYGYGIEWYAEY